MNEIEQRKMAELETAGVVLGEPTWETCREWLKARDWKINVLSDYPGGEVRLTVRHGFERIEVTGKSDLDAMAGAILEISRRERVHGEG